jgi:luciferase family oxidoreductase group 1
MKLSLLDQSPILSGRSATDGLHATLDLAQAAEALGYHRFWLAEHHGLAALADPCPEILLAAIGARTQRIRLGTGGIMLPYYAPFKVAEQFRMLSALYPGRIDLGVGRAPGGDMGTAQAVIGSTLGRHYDGGEQFPQAVAELIALLDDALPPDHPYEQVKLQPEADAASAAPELWVLGSSDFGGLLAAQMGLRYVFAHFINPHGAVMLKHYKERFQAAPHAASTRGAVTKAPYCALAVFALAAETEAQAADLLAATDVRRLQMAYGLNAPIPTMEDAKARLQFLSERDRLIIERERPRSIIGTPDQVADRLAQLAEESGADELIVLAMAPDYDLRLKSAELIARAMVAGKRETADDMAEAAAA